MLCGLMLKQRFINNNYYIEEETWWNLNEKCTLFDTRKNFSFVRDAMVLVINIAWKYKGF